MPGIHTPLATVAALAALALAPAPLRAQPIPDVPPRTAERIASLADLYGAVRWFHPGVTPTDSGRAAWDAAVADAVEGIAREGGREAYRREVERLVASLGDPATRVEEDAGRLPRGWRLRWRASGTLVAQLARRGVDDAWLLREMERADRVVFDLRASPLAEPFERSGIAAHLVERPVPGPRVRRWWLRGYPPEQPIYGGGYKPYDQGWQVADGAAVAPADGARVRRVAFLLAAGAEAPPSALALRRAGVASLVAEGPLSDAALARPYRVRLADGIAVRVRTAQPVDAGAAVLADSVVAPSEGADGPALEAGLALVARPARTAAAALAPDSVSVEVPPDTAGAAYPRPGMRVVAGYRAWNLAKRFFPYAALMGEDWDAVLRDAVPGLLGAPDSVGHALAVAALSTRLHDSHAWAESPTLRAHFGDTQVGVALRMVEGVPVVAALKSDSLGEAVGLRVGDEVLAVDGEPAAERLARAARATAGSTPHARADAILTSRFLAGPRGSTALLRVRGADGAEREVRIPRDGDPEWWHALRRRPGERVRVLEGGVGYVDLTRLGMAQVDSVLGLLRDAPALVFDLRGYPDMAAWAIAPRLASSDTAIVSRDVVRRIPSPDTLAVEPVAGLTRLSDIPRMGGASSGPAQGGYAGRIVVLMDERTQSRAESSVQLLRAAGAVLVGGPTAGANGDVTAMNLPGGIVLRFSGAEVLGPVGEQVQRKGIQPDHPAAPTLAGLRAGRDEVLEKALEVVGVRETSPPAPGASAGSGAGRAR